MRTVGATKAPTLLALVLAQLVLVALAPRGRRMDVRGEPAGLDAAGRRHHRVELRQQPESALLARDHTERRARRALVVVVRRRHARAGAPVGVGDEDTALLVHRDVVEVE